MRITESWRLKENRYALSGVELQEETAKTFPPRPVNARPVELFDFNQEEKQEYTMPVYASIEK